MDLTKLFSFLQSKGYHYFEGTNYNNVVSFEITTAYHGRGNAVEITIKNGICGVHVWLQQNSPTPPIEHEQYEINEEQLYTFLNQHLIS